MSTASHESAEIDELSADRDPPITHEGLARDNRALRDDVARDVDLTASEYELGEDYASYRSLSAAAVVSCALGVGSFLAFLDWWLVIIPLAGVAIGIFALRKVAERSEELTGRVPAALGVCLSLAGLIGGQATLWYVRLTEVPDGHVRMSYSDLQPPLRSVVPIPDSAREFDGKQVFVKGYVLAGNRKDGIRTFILVRDKGDCCFGGNPKLTDRILVQLKPGHFFSYTDRVQKLAGKFHIRHGQAVDVAGDVVYQIDDAEIL